MTKPAPMQAAALAELDLDAAPRFTTLGTAIVTVDGDKLTVSRDGLVDEASRSVRLLREHLGNLRREFEAAEGRRRGPWGAAIKSTEREIAEVTR